MTQPPVENLGERMRTEETMEAGETGNGAPTHTMPESCQYWDYTNNLFYISLGGGVWQLIGGVGGGVPAGIIAMWSGAIVDIPAGWTLCDGTGGAPDLRDRFVVGAGAAYVVGSTGGAATNDLTHTHGGGTLTTTTNSHWHICNFSLGFGTLAADNSTHNHFSGTLVTGASLTTAGKDNLDGVAFDMVVQSHTHNISGSTQNNSHGHPISGITGQDSHNHTMASGTTSSAGSAVRENRPPYYALAFIMRL